MGQLRSSKDNTPPQTDIEERQFVSIKYDFPDGTGGFPIFWGPDQDTQQRYNEPTNWHLDAVLRVPNLARFSYLGSAIDSEYFGNNDDDGGGLYEGKLTRVLQYTCQPFDFISGALADYYVTYWGVAEDGKSAKWPYPPISSDCMSDFNGHAIVAQYIIRCPVAQLGDCACHPDCVIPRGGEIIAPPYGTGELQFEVVSGTVPPGFDYAIYTVDNTCGEITPRPPDFTVGYGSECP